MNKFFSHLAPPDIDDPVVAAYQKDVDVSLLRENLRLSVDERIRKAEKFLRSLDAVRGIASSQPAKE